MIISLSLLTISMLVGIFGFILIEDYAFVEALYMTVITVSTVGYQVTKPLSTEGMVRILTI